MRSTTLPPLPLAFSIVDDAKRGAGPLLLLNLPTKENGFSPPPLPLLLLQAAVPATPCRPLDCMVHVPPPLSYEKEPRPLLEEWDGCKTTNGGGCWGCCGDGARDPETGAAFATSDADHGVTALGASKVELTQVVPNMRALGRGAVPPPAAVFEEVIPPCGRPLDAGPPCGYTSTGLWTGKTTVDPVVEWSANVKSLASPPSGASCPPFGAGRMCCTRGFGGGTRGRSSGSIVASPCVADPSWCDSRSRGL